MADGIATEVWGFLNTNFSAALFGAFAGALSAQMIAARSDRRQRLSAEIAGVNNSIQLANAITNTFLMLKGQHVSPMTRIYQKQFNDYVDLVIHPPVAKPIAQHIHTVAMNFHALAIPLTPITELRETILDRVPTSIQAISVSVILHQCIDSLASSLTDRLSTIEAIQAYPFEVRPDVYFGLRNPRGFDERYADSMTAIFNYTDDCIYFSMLLSDVLIRHGEKLGAKAGRNAPHVGKLDYSSVDTALLPDHANYPSFEKTFRPAVKNTHVVM